MKESRQSGFSLVELIVVIAIMGTVMGIATPNVLEWSRGLKYKEAARTLASVMRDTRAQAVNENREYRVLIDVGGNGSFTIGGATVTVPSYGYTVQKGRLANNSSTFGGSGTVVENGVNVTYVNGWTTTVPGGLPLISNPRPNSRLALRSTVNCTSTNDVSIQFNPNGTSENRYVCVMDTQNMATRRFIVGIPTVNSGRVVISR